jgi:hypothetical protein
MTTLFRRRKIWLLPHPLPLSRQQVVSLSQSSCVKPVDLTDRRGNAAESNDGEKALSSVNHSILSVTLSPNHPPNPEISSADIRTHPYVDTRGVFLRRLAFALFISLGEMGAEFIT